MDEDMSDFSRYKQGPQKVVLKLRGKDAGLYVKNMFGTRAYGQIGILKTSALRREMDLRIGTRVVKDLIDDLKVMGMLRWPEFKKERANLNRLMGSIRRSIKTYKGRRLEVGMFYLTPCYDTYDVAVHSHLLRMPLKEALKRRRQDLKKRRAILASYNNNANQTKASAEHHVVPPKTVLGVARRTSLLSHAVASIFIGCIIVLIP